MTLIKTCAVCGKQFETKAKNVTCSSECRAIRKAEQDRAAARRQRAKFPASLKWLPIPDAPKYEINAQLQCRNKKTGRLLKQTYRKGSRYNPNTVCYYLTGKNGQDIFRSAETLRRQAIAAVTPNKFLPVPSLQKLYEVNRQGICRSVRLLKPLKYLNGRYAFIIGGKAISRSKADLVFEVFGETLKGSRLQLPVVLSKGNKCLHFNNKKEAAKFLAPIVFLAFNTVHSYLAKYKSDIYGWRVTYTNRDYDNYKQTLDLEARRQKRVYNKTVERQQQGNHHA